MFRRLSIGLLTVMLIISMQFSVSAQGIKLSSPRSALEITNSKNTVKLYSVDEITNVDQLVLRAEAGIDELYQRTGMRLKCGVNAPDNVNVKTQYTSQLLSVLEHEGKQYEQYVASAIADIEYSSEQLWNNSVNSQGQDYNYRVVNHIYFLRDSASSYVYYQRSMTVFNTLGSVQYHPVSLHVTNWVTLDIITYPGEYPQETYSVSNTFAPINENTPYTLGSPFSQKIWCSAFSYLKTKAILNLDHGKTVESFCYLQVL